MDPATPANPVDEAVDLKNLTRVETRALLARLGEQPYRGDQVYRWVHGRGATTAAGMSDLGRGLRERLATATTVGELAVDAVQLSRDGTRKLRLRTSDGRFLESVLIPDGDAGAPDDDLDEGDADAGNAPIDAMGDATSDAVGDSIGDAVEVAAAGDVPGGRFVGGSDRHAAMGPRARRRKLTQCISSQVGCALDCTFCATALLGFGRNLTAGEIVDQLYRARALLGGLDAGDATLRAGADHVTHLVFMGMGEPLHNLKELLRAIAMLTDPSGVALSPRRITVSTAGLVPAIARLAEAGTRVNLAVSLNATTDDVRDRVMPINRKWNLDALLGAVRAFPLERRRRVTFEYVLLGGVNDALDDARRLPRLLRGIPSKVNLIPWNPHPGSPFRRPSDDVVERFQAECKREGLAAYVRRSRGVDIDAACGQLAAKAAPASSPALVQLGAR